jgi:tetratricopeptide (TPR) repeat protein/transcriptional regulator with XRE-family HTH domain
MVDPAADEPDRPLTRQAAEARTLPQLAELLRVLRRRHARGRRDRELTYRDLAERTGWSLTSIAEYFTARRLPPVERFDALLVLLGADLAEQGALASARDRVDEHRRDGGRRPAVATVGTDPVVPRQLPPAIRHFDGRGRELAELAGLTAAVGSADVKAAAGTVVITAIGGTAGVGKTTLALHWAHQVADQFPDGHLYVNLRGFDPGGRALDPVEATRGFLDALRVPLSRVPADPQAQTALYRSLLADRRMVVVLDNAHDAGQVRPLLPAAPRCLVIVTSRNPLSSLVAAEGARPVTLDLFTAPEARQMLAGRLGEDRVADAGDAVADIIARCSRLPLALAVVAARVATQPRLPLAEVARELADASGRLDVLADQDPSSDVRAVFSWSYEALSAPAARLFRLLGLHPGPDLTVPAAASVAGVAVPEARALLAELRGTGLITSQYAGRYAYHDLLAVYAADLARGVDTEPDRRIATGRIIDHYLAAAREASRLLDPTADVPEPVALHDGVVAERFTGAGQALDWFVAEHAVLLNVVGLAAADGLDASVGPLAGAVALFLDRQGHWSDALAVWDNALSCAIRLGDLAAQARAQRQLGRACTRMYLFADAGAHLDRALHLARRAGDRLEQAHIQHMYAILCERRGDLSRAIVHDRQSLDLYRATAHQLGQAKMHNAIGWHLTLLGEPGQAIGYCREALTMLERLHDRAGQAHTWDSIGHAYHQLGEYGRAMAAYRRSLDLVRALGDRFGEAEERDRIGDVRRDTGDLAEARRSWRQALDILIELGHPAAEQLQAKLGGGLAG